MSVKERKKLYIFLAIAFGVMALMSVFMVIGLKGGKDLTVFVNAMMTYPACGVILGMMLFDRMEKKLPMVGFWAFLITSLLMVIFALKSAFAPQQMIDSGAGLITNWNLYSQYILMLGSVIAYIAFWACGKEKRKNAGLSRNNILLSVVMILVFLVLFFGRNYLALITANIMEGKGIGDLSELNAMTFNPMNWFNAAIIMINFPLTFIAFLGEEYGCRYYLQPIMQKIFGLRLGVILLGVVWGLWHTAADFMFYSTDSGPQVLVTQIITCVTMSIFFAYAYMKTQNIWAIAIMHFINNNFIVVFSGGDVNVLQNQSITWSQMPIMIVRSLIFALFIFAPIFNKKKVAEETNTLNTVV